MRTGSVLRARWRIVLGLIATFAAICLVLTTFLSVFADTVRISDPVGVLNASQIKSEGSKLTYPLDIYTTDTYEGTAADFVQRTIAVHLTSKNLIVIAIDTYHRFLAIVGGSSVPVTKSEYTSAGTAFKNNINSSDFTSATLAAIRSLESSLGIGRSGTSGSGSVLGFIILVVIVGIIIVISLIVHFIRRLFGISSPPSNPTLPPPTYGDGRDNFGSGAAGSF
jgi:hypothetical protein